MNCGLVIDVDLSEFEVILDSEFYYQQLSKSANQQLTPNNLSAT
jgi:hypothetical protein